MKTRSGHSCQNDVPRWDVMFRLARVVMLSFAIVVFLFFARTEVAHAGDTVLDQCANDYQSNGSNHPNLGACTWIPGNIQGKSWYLEGMSVPQRLFFKGLAAGPKTLTWTIDWSSGSGGTAQHGLDFLTSWEQAQLTSTAYAGFGLILNECAGVQQGFTCSDADLPGSFRIEIPDTNNAPAGDFTSGLCNWNCSKQAKITAFETKFPSLASQGRTVRLRTNSSTAPTSVTWNITHDCTTAACDYSGLHTVTYALTFDGPATAGILEFAVHIALSGNNHIDSIAWGQDVGSWPIAGSNWHVSASGGGQGKDNQIAVEGGALSPIGSTPGPSTGMLGVNKPYTDTVTITLTGNRPAITGNIDFFVCADTTYPYTALPYGCTQTTAVTSPADSAFSVVHLTGAPDNPTVQPIRLDYLACGNDTCARAISPTFTPQSTGRYCFYTAYIPPTTLPHTYVPTADSDYPSECFYVLAPTAVEVSDLRATDLNNGYVMSNVIVPLAVLGIVPLLAIAVVLLRRHVND